MRKKALRKAGLQQPALCERHERIARDDHTWSSTRTSTGARALLSFIVIERSASDGSGTPDG